MPEHTPEPWTVGRELASAKVEITSQPDGVTGACNLIADVHSILKSLGGVGARDANARRIVACVNACQGIPTETLEAGALGAQLAASMPAYDKSRTLAELVAETCGDDPDPAFVYCATGNACAFSEAGTLVPYDAEAAAKYGDIVLFPTLPHMSDDRVECIYASTWIDGADGYRFQIRF